MSADIGIRFRILKRKSVFLLLILLCFFFIHIYRMGSITFTGDEEADARIAECYIQSKNPFSCAHDITQTRLPYYIHTIFYLIFGSFTGKYTHYIVSLIFGLTNLILIYLFTKKNFNESIARITLLLIVTSIPLLISSRMPLKLCRKVEIYLFEPGMFLPHWEIIWRGMRVNTLASWRLR